MLRPGETFEDLLGGRILAVVGGLAILIGVVFFLVIAVDRGWIGVEARVALAFVGSTLLLAAGVFLYERRGQTDAAVVAVATALASLFASLTYATAAKDVVGSEAGLVVAAIIGAAGAAIAIRWSSQIVAAFALLGALAAPVLVDSGTSTLALAFTSVALAATVAVLVWQRWGWLALGAFALTCAAARVLGRRPGRPAPAAPRPRALLVRASSWPGSATSCGFRPRSSACRRPRSSC